MLLLRRNPWPSDFPLLMEVMKNSQSDCWSIVNGLFSYRLQDIPFQQPVPERLATKRVTFFQPEDFCSDEFFWDILKGMKKIGGDLLVLEAGLLQKRLWGVGCSGYGEGNKGSKTESFAEIFNEIVDANHGLSYGFLGNRIQYFVEDGIVHICSSQSAKVRWLKWWDEQSAEYKSWLGMLRSDGR